MARPLTGFVISGSSNISLRHTRQKFVTQIDMELLVALKDKVQSEKRKIRSMFEGAFRSRLEGQDSQDPRRVVMEAYQSSHENFLNSLKS